MKRRFFTLDVFTDKALQGNPLAVVMDAQGLDTKAMQAIAREFNLSETVFVLPASEATCRARIRIFTPGLEMPFAGHPTVGTAVLLANLDHPHQDATFSFSLQENIGIVPCRVALKSTGASVARFSLPKLPSRSGEAKDAELLARALGLNANDIGCDGHDPSVFGAGFPYSLVPVRDLETIGRIRINTAIWQEAFGQDGLGAAYAYTRQTVHPHSSFHARMFSPGDGIPEDPATGSAVAAFAGALMAFEKLAEGEHSFVIEQGYEMGRPSLITLGMTVEKATLVAATIGGSAVIVSDGTLSL